MNADQQTEYIVQCIRDAGSMYKDDARKFLAEHDAHVRAEALAEEKASAPAPTATPDFFEPGHAYTHRDGSDFHCVAITAHPKTGQRLAMGWRSENDEWHRPTVCNLGQWLHEYDGVQAPDGDR